MQELESLPTPAILERLPPIEHAPILEHLGHLGLAKFRENYAIETPLNDDGTVDHLALIAELRRFVSPDYRWKAPFFDEHHLHWAASKYTPDKFNGDTVPYKFRDLPTEKIWVAREFHKFAHIMTFESGVPDRSVMSERIDRFQRRSYMYRLASEALSLSERKARSHYEPQIEKLIDPETKRVYSPGVLEKRRKEFIHKLEESFSHGLPPDLTELSILQLIEEGSLEESLPRIRRKLGEAAVCQSKKRRARPVSLPVERVPLQKAA